MQDYYRTLAMKYRRYCVCGASYDTSTEFAKHRSVGGYKNHWEISIRQFKKKHPKNYRIAKNSDHMTMIRDRLQKAGQWIPGTPPPPLPPLFDDDEPPPEPQARGKAQGE